MNTNMNPPKKPSRNTKPKPPEQIVLKAAITNADENGEVRFTGKLRVFMGSKEVGEPPFTCETGSEEAAATLLAAFLTKPVNPR